VYEQSVAKVGGWYTAEQAAFGRNPLSGKVRELPRSETGGRRWAVSEGPYVAPGCMEGQDSLTVWGEITGPMAQYAGTTYTTRSRWILCRTCCNKMGCPRGTSRLRTRENCRRLLPAK